MTHFDARGGNDARIEPKILISWSLWVSIDSALKDESIELPNALAPFIPVKMSHTKTKAFNYSDNNDMFGAEMRGTIALIQGRFRAR